MIKLIKKNTCSTNTLSYLFRFVIILFLSCFCIEGNAQIDKHKTLTKSFDLGRNGDLKITHRNGPLIVKSSNDGKTSIQLSMHIAGEREGDIQKVLDRVELKEEGFGSKMELATSFNYQSWVTHNGNTQIIFNDGTKVYDLSKIELEMIVFIPKLQSLYLENKYDNIEVSNIDTDLSIKIYSGELHAGNISGNIDLDMKYGEGHIGNIKNGTIKLYDTELLLGNAKDLEITSKYSSFTLGYMDNCKLNSYDDEYEIENVKKKLLITDKYSDIEVTSFIDSEMDLYDSEISIGDGGNLKLKSKYSVYKINTLNTLNVVPSNDDNFKIKELVDLDMESKYSTYNIGYFKGQLSVYSYDDVIDIERVANNFKGVNIEGKHTKLYFPIPNDVAYAIDADMNRGNLDYRESQFEASIFREKSATTALKAKSKGATDNSPIVRIKTYDSRIDLN